MCATLSHLPAGKRGDVVSWAEVCRRGLVLDMFSESAQGRKSSVFIYIYKSIFIGKRSCVIF